MKLVTYSTNGGAPQVGEIEGEQIRPVGGPGTTMMEIIEHGRDAERVPGGDPVALGSVRLHAPVLNPQKIIGIGLNYSDHAAETGAEIPEKPIVFAKYANTLVGQRDAIKIPPITQKADYEVELVA